MAKKHRKQKTRGKKKPTAKVLSRLPATRYKEVANAIDMAMQLLSRGSFSEALELCKQARHIEPRNPELHLTVAEIHARSGEIDNAEKAFKTAFQLAPNFLPAMSNYALMLYEAGRREKCLSAYKAVLALEPGFVPALAGITKVLVDLRRFQQAVPYAKRLVSARGDTSDLVELIRCQDMSGDASAALENCDNALKQGKHRGTFQTLAGSIALSRGNRDEATHRFLDAIEHDGHFSYLNLARMKGHEDLQTRIVAEISASSDSAIASVRAPLIFANANILEQQGEFEAAFEQFKAANQLVSRVVAEDNELRASFSRKHQELFSIDQIKEIHKGKTSQSAQPVFVTGLPRSGTTLVEQIITSHSEAQGLGELELLPMLLHGVTRLDSQNIFAAAKSYCAAYPAEYKSTRKIVDKSIGSLLHLGLVFAMFPNARVVYCERSPLDVAWSAFKEYFNEGALAYTYSFERIAEHQKIYAQNIEHWQSLFPEKILRLRYEDLVMEPEVHSKRLIAHIGLDWQDACMDFHKNSGPVRTASLDQVRQPIYTSSIARWKPYARWLDGVQELLRDEIANYEQQRQAN
jgi:tetratricopeptide (TPR) repeat protein